MEQNNEAIVHNEPKEQPNDTVIDYNELMEQVNEVIGYDMAEKPAEEVAVCDKCEEKSDEPIVNNEPMEQELKLKEVTPEAPAKGRKKPLWAVLIVVVVLAAGYLGLCAYADSLNTFYPGQAINGVDVSGLSVSQAQTKLEEALSAQQVTLTHAETGEVLAALPLMELGYDLEDFAGDAQFWMDTQQNRDFLGKGWAFGNFLLGRWPGGSNWPDYDGEERMQTLTKLSGELYQEPVHAAYELGEGVIRITKARDGRTLNVAELTGALLDTGLYSRDWQTDIYFETLPADTFTAQELHDEVYGTMVNASYDRETETILPEQVGVDFNVAAAQAAINGAEPGQTVEIEAAIDQPAVTAEELEKVLFRDVLGEWKTHVSGTAARINNVKLSAATINGYVMNAGDVFSYNEVVGQRTAANGYQAAPAYIRGETVDEIGGGICQTSSTLYYACLLSQLEIVERYPHRYVPAYIPWGMDATVSWGGPDYKFANNTVYPVKVVTEYSKGYLTVKLLGTQTLDTTVKMTNEVVSTTPWVTVYEVDETLAPGTPDTEKTSPYTGYKVLAYRNLYDKAGKLISSTLESTNNYKVRNKVIVQAPPVTGTEVPVMTNPVTGEVIVELPGETAPAEQETVPETPSGVEETGSGQVGGSVTAEVSVETLTEGI